MAITNCQVNELGNCPALYLQRVADSSVVIQLIQPSNDPGFFSGNWDFTNKGGTPPIVISSDTFLWLASRFNNRYRGFNSSRVDILMDIDQQKLEGIIGIGSTNIGANLASPLWRYIMICPIWWLECHQVGIPLYQGKVKHCRKIHGHCVFTIDIHVT